MEKDKKPIVKRPEVLKKLNADSLFMIERGLLGDLPKKLQPRPIVPVRAQCHDVVPAKSSGFLSSCLPVIPDSPDRVTSSDEEGGASPLKKTFSFRDRLSRISFFGKDKEKPKWKTIEEHEKYDKSPGVDKVPFKTQRTNTKAEHDFKNNKRFWWFRNKELEKRNQHKPIYTRSKSFEFLPRAIEEEEEEMTPKIKRNSQSYMFGSGDTMGDAWISNESLEYISNVYHDSDDGVFLKSIKEIASDLSGNNSSTSFMTSSSSAKPEVNILKTESVENVFNEFNKAVELFSETYLSDCETYTKSKQLTLKQKRKSASFTTLPSPKVVHASKVSEVSEEFKKELSIMLSVKNDVRSVRRGSVTDWFVLDDQGAAAMDHNKYKRSQKKDMNRVRRMSSTKYWITPEECAVYSRDQRPPLVIPRITQQYRTPRQRIPSGSMYPEESPKSEKRPLRSHGYAQLDNWSPTSDRCRRDLDAAFKASTDSPPFARGPMNRFGGSTENLLTCNARRPNYLQLPASSSGDSLDVDVERREPTGAYRNRKSRSMQVPKNRLRSPVPLPRQHIMMQQPTNEIIVLKEGLVKRTKFWSSHKKVKKNWIECYMVLTPNALVFYKDQKTFNNYKQSKPGTPPSPSAPITFILPLKDASATDCTTKHTKRSRAMCLDLNGEGYLIQDMESDENARHWLYSIQEVIHSMSNGLRPRPRISPPPTYQSSTTDAESLSRTPPTSRHPKTKQKAGGDSNEDSEDQETQKSYVRSKLRQFFAKRPAMDQLVKIGIYKDEPVFGRKLEDVRCSGGSKVPDFVVACVDKIESSKENMCTDGLYRASGNLSQVQKIRLEVDQSNMSVINNNNDIHVLTGSLKLFFRELKEPLIPFCLFDRVLNACSIKNRDARIKEFREIVKLLPEHNRDTLKFLLTHLLKVTKYAEHNRMHTANLAIVFGPTLLWAPAEKAHNIAVDCIQQNNVVDILLTEFKEIFPDN